MKLYINPPQKDWSILIKRKGLENDKIEEPVQNIIKRVKDDGDKALKFFAEKFDKVSLEKFKVTKEEIEEGNRQTNENLKEAIRIASKNIQKFHESQKITEPKVETMPGVFCWRNSVPIENVGLYIPGGSAPLFSTILMLAIPARIAGCRRIILCTPPDKEGKINPAILYTAKILEVTEIYKVGGAQAIAAMGFGTQSIPKVDKIFGPGNQFVTKAKELIQKQGIAIDIPAGPSEVLIIADKKANPEFVAADLLSQAEHGPDSQVVLLTDNKNLEKKVGEAIHRQIAVLPREEIAEKALRNSFSVFFDSLDTCIEFSNCYAPEHLILNLDQPEQYISQIQNAGSVFLGVYSCESMGDYASGTNHTLPTNGYARSYSGVSLDSFVKKITFQKLTKQGLLNLGKTVETMAEAEQLFAHKNAVSIRLKNINNGS